MLRERLPTPSPPLLSGPNRRSSYLRCALGGVCCLSPAVPLASLQLRIPPACGSLGDPRGPNSPPY